MRCPQQNVSDSEVEDDVHDADQTAVDVVEEVLEVFRAVALDVEINEDAEPDDSEEESEQKAVGELVENVPAEQSRELEHHQIREELQVALDQHQEQVGPQRVLHQKSGHFVVLEQAISKREDGKHAQSQQEVREEEAHGVDEEAVGDLFDLEELLRGVVPLSVEFLFDCGQVDAQKVPEVLKGDEAPLVLLQLLDLVEESLNDHVVGSRVVVVEPQVVNIDKEAEERG